MRAIVFKDGGPLCRRRRPGKILDTYLEPDKSFVELREMAINGTIDLLRGFKRRVPRRIRGNAAIQF